MTLTIEELRILLALNGNQRMEYLEEEIFSSVECVTEYLVALTRNWLGNSTMCINNSLRASWYAWNFCEHRQWLAAESCIRQCTKTWNIYQERIKELK